MRYRVQGLMTISVYVVVEANSEAEAREKADECSTQTLCNGCASPMDEGEWHTSGELDGTPVVENVEEA